MQPSVISYTVGIRRRFLPIWKKFSVTSHDSEIIADDVRLHMQLTDGSQLVVPGISRRQFKVYPDYRNAQVMIEKLRAPQQPGPRAVDDVSEFDRLLQGARATGG